ncbi:MAG TPA: 50S ribosomal protein L17 [Candidatus Eisenbacteria bacterium]|nr:50S ribosomal protein L17 [Candidatus Eisenbacteria bacterium]
MRHRKAFRKLSRTREHRRALLRNLVTSLFIHERIETTVAKAKEARRVGERMITFAKRGDLSARRHVASYVHGDDVVKKLFETVAPWYAERNGGYTRIVRIGRRLGDAGETALLELVKSPELKEKLRAEAEERIKAEKAAGKAAGKAAKGKKDAAAAAAAAEGAAPAAEAPAKKGRAEKKPKPPRSERRGGKKSMPGGKSTTRGRQQGRSGD